MTLRLREARQTNTSILLVVMRYYEVIFGVVKGSGVFGVVVLLAGVYWGTFSGVLIKV